MNTMNSHITAAANESSPRWEKVQAAQTAPQDLMAFARAGSQAAVSGKQRLASLAATIAVQAVFTAVLVYGLVLKPATSAPPIMVVSIEELTTEPELPPPPPPKMQTPQLIAQPITALQIYEPPPDVVVHTTTPAPTAIGVSAMPVSVNPDVAIQNFQINLLRHLNRHKRSKVRNKREQDMVHVRFAMDRQGRVLSVALEKACPFASLNEEAVAMVQRASPLPAPPRELPGESIEMVVPIDFRQR